MGAKPFGAQPTPVGRRNAKHGADAPTPHPYPRRIKARAAASR